MYLEIVPSFIYLDFTTSRVKVGTSLKMYAQPVKVFDEKQCIKVISVQT